jgi:hypothetical protein
MMTRLLRSPFVSGALVALALAPSAVRAQTTTHTTLSSFLAATQPGAWTNTFTEAPSLRASPVVYSQGAFSYQVSAAGGATPIYVSGGGVSGSFIGNTYGNQQLVFTFLAGNVTAIGGNFFITDINDAFQAAPVTITLSNGTTTTFTPGGISDFRGFTTTGAAITSLTLSAPGASRFNSVDNFVVGLAATSTNVVPEPSTYVLMASGLLMLGAVTRRRARS